MPTHATNKKATTGNRKPAYLKAKSSHNQVLQKAADSTNCKSTRIRSISIIHT
uniref:Uncharacterized protein n=1 Tax=Arundo donax TaxID=35708 RepID=A0A0A9CIS5_ARUDO